MEIKSRKKDKKVDQGEDSEDSFEFNGGALAKGPQTSLPLKMPQHSTLTHNKGQLPRRSSLCFNSYKSTSLVEVGKQIIDSARLKTLCKQPL